MEVARIFYGHLVYFTATAYTFCPFGIFMVIWYSFPCFGLLYQEKSGNPGQPSGAVVTWICVTTNLL
jgi:hypothetical protein